MEVAVTDMADDRRQEPAFGNVALGLDDAFGKPRYRHADVGRDNLRARPERLARQRGVMASLPQTGPLLLPRPPLKGPPAVLARDVAETLRLLGDTRRRAVEFQKQHRRLGQRQLGMKIDRAHLERVKQFDAR